MPFTFTIAKSVTKTVVATPADADEGPGALAGGNIPTWEAVDATHLSVVQDC